MRAILFLLLACPAAFASCVSTSADLIHTKSCITVTPNPQFVPPVISGTYQLWADTIHSAITKDGGGNVTKVTDLSGRGFDLSSGGTSADGKVSGNVPFSATGINGHPALHFGSTQAWLQTASNFGTNVSGNFSATIFLVVQLNSLTVGGGLAGWGNGFGPGGIGAGVYYPANPWEFALGSANNTLFTNGKQTTAQIIVISKTPGAMNSSGNWAAWVNETSNPYASSTSSINPNADGTMPFSWGIWCNYASNAGLGDGRTDHWGSAAVVVTPAVSDADRLSITRSLNSAFTVY